MCFATICFSKQHIRKWLHHAGDALFCSMEAEGSRSCACLQSWELSSTHLPLCIALTSGNLMMRRQTPVLLPFPDLTEPAVAFPRYVQPGIDPRRIVRIDKIYLQACTRQHWIKLCCTSPTVSS